MRELANQLEVENWLMSAASALTIPSMKTFAGVEHVILTLNYNDKSLSVNKFAKNELKKALNYYAQLEKQNADHLGRDSVFVSVSELAKLKKAYPNYFLDSNVFLGILKNVLAPSPTIAEK